MEPFTMEEYSEMWEKTHEKQNRNDPWLVYVAEKSRTSCTACQENHAKRFRASDPEKPELPAHPNCRCKYEALETVPSDKITMKSITMEVNGKTSAGNFSIHSVDDMLNILEKTCNP